MTNQINHIIQSIDRLLPMMLISGNINYILLLSPIILIFGEKILKWIIKYIKSFFENNNIPNNYASITIPVLDINGINNINQTNIYYDRIMWYLNKKYNIYQKSGKLIMKDCLFINENDSSISFNTKLWSNLKKTRPLYECNINNIIKIKFEDFIFYLTSGYTNIKKTTNDNITNVTIEALIIYGENIDRINEMINICSKKYIDYHKSLQNDDPYDDNRIFKRRIIKMKNMKQEKWVGFPINVKKNFSNIFLEEKNMILIRDTINEFVSSVDFYYKSGQPYKLGFLFYGIPGCGKTSTIYAIANEYKRDIYSFNLGKIKSDTDLEQIFREVKDNSIVVIEDIDCYKLVHQRKYEKPKDENIVINYFHDDEKKNDDKKPTLGTLLHILDGYHYLNGCIIIFTTNRKDIIDDAVIRPGRIDHQILFDYCNKNQIKMIYNYFTGEELLDEIINLLEEKKFTSSKIINSIILANRHKPENIIKIFEKLVYDDL